MTNKPSIDPADEGDLLGTLRHILKKEMQQHDGMLPARVVSYDRTRKRATVQPLVMMLTTSNSTVKRATLASIPVYQIGGGGFVLDFNINPGDLGWIKANDRDISLFLQSYAEAAPNTVRTHNFSDSVFFPDVMRGYTIAGDDSANAVLQSLDGSVKISLSTTWVKITAPSIEFVSDILTHNGVNIGAPHTHGGVAPGAGNTGVPN